MQYQTHWRLAFVLAFFFHIIAWLFLTILIPHVFKALEAPPQEEPMEWVELADDPGPPEEEQAEEPPPPPPPPPEPEQVEEEPAVVEAEVPEEAITEIMKEVEETPEKEEPKVLRSGEGKQIGQPGKILHAEQPPYGAIQFKGRIAVSARIGTDGKVISTRIQVSSGNALYDRMARRIVEKQWKFEPAKDMNGQPMESDMQCPVYFNMKPARNIK
ncbi:MULTISPECIES: energy transducer TonB [unclassified Selenomonas]|uniref:energy transducer TonB n=1 Tax=unclassified Selenomonas TaxID=2637378 RepID=UPI000278295B|nr:MULTISPECIES: energy transducer TonB [unclassified Selenomonas]EJO17745.1 TonB-dependent receptor [Selenomonas sp. FOBRC6]EKX94975.1 TonB family domain protein [Selenomonas sp. oral taxon 138 str. F0429]